MSRHRTPPLGKEDFVIAKNEKRMKKKVKIACEQVKNLWCRCGRIDEVTSSSSVDEGGPSQDTGLRDRCGGPSEVL